MRLLPTFLSLVNAVSGILACTLLASGETVATLFLFQLAVLADVWDGWAARTLRVETRTGAIVDAVADVISFGAAPALAIAVLLSFDRFATTSFVLFVVALNIHRHIRLLGGTSRGGLPNIVMAAQVILGLVHGISHIAVFLISVVQSYLMVSHVSYPTHRTSFSGRYERGSLRWPLLATCLVVGCANELLGVVGWLMAVCYTFLVPSARFMRPLLGQHVQRPLRPRIAPAALEESTAGTAGPGTR